jgi:hypothetical protein
MFLSPEDQPNNSAIESPIAARREEDKKDLALVIFS